MEAQNPTALHAELPALLPAWLPQQRWFAAKGRPVASVAVAAHTPLLTEGDPLLDLRPAGRRVRRRRAGRSTTSSWSAAARPRAGSWST